MIPTKKSTEQSTRSNQADRSHRDIQTQLSTGEGVHDGPPETPSEKRPPTPMATNRSTRRWREKIRPQTRAQHAKDNTPCWICGQPIDYTITATDDDNAWEPDHIYPVSTHPELYDDPNNLRASHRGCNRQRGNKKHTEIHTLGTPKRNWFG